MNHRLKRHPFPVRARFDHVVVLTYAVDPERLSRRLPPGLEVDTFGGHGFVALALVWTRELRPAFLPSAWGRDVALAGLRIFTRYRDRSGRRLRGLRIIDSFTDRPSMVTLGNLFTHYNYQASIIDLDVESNGLSFELTAPPSGLAVAGSIRFAEAPATPGPQSPFTDWRTARRYAGPLPFTFDYEAETHSMVVVRGRREAWRPRPVNVHLTTERLPRETFGDEPPTLAAAFHVRDIPYRWDAGYVEGLREVRHAS